jgi:hypothetical protein
MVGGRSFARPPPRPQIEKTKVEGTDNVYIVDHYNHLRYQESLQNLAPADIYFGRGSTILLERKRIKRDTIRQRRLQHQRKAA